MLGHGFRAPTLRSSLSALFASLAIACSSDTTGASSSELSSKLVGRTFLSTEVKGHDLVLGTQIRLDFKSELGVSAGCNHIFGSYTIEGWVLHMPNAGTTEIGCGQELQAQDEWITALLTSSPRLSLDDPKLTVTTDDVVITLLDRDVASPDRPLVGTRWIGNGTGDEQAVSFGTGSDQVRLSFDAGGAIEVFTACQKGTGRFSTNGGAITFQDLAYDGAACPDASLEGLSQTVMSVLDGSPVTYTIEEARLQITRDGRLLMFAAAE